MVVTGATASIKGSARFATFAAGKFALRAMTQSLAREFGPQGVHVAHVIVDGVIDTEATKAFTVNGGAADGKLQPDAVRRILCSPSSRPPPLFFFWGGGSCSLFVVDSTLILRDGLENRLLKPTGTCTRNTDLPLPKRLTSDLTLKSFRGSIKPIVWQSLWQYVSLKLNR